MRRETELFLDNIIRTDSSLLELLDSNHSFLNERLARFYGVPGVTGPEFRKVDMSRTERGGGILAHASLLTVTSYSTRTSPVVRGKWILETLLNAPQPPPPPGVPPFEDTKLGKDATLRQQMEAYRNNSVCASCHARMDPLGFGLENFNAIGLWRTQEPRRRNAGRRPMRRGWRGCGAGLTSRARDRPRPASSQPRCSEPPRRG